jgi:DNA-binding MarR family transcriptional regulator
MSLIDEILQGLPVNSLLREKVAKLDAEKATTETENAILKDDNRNLKTENAQLKKQIEGLTTYNAELDEMELEFMKTISAHDTLTADEIAQRLQLNLQRVRYHLQRLQDVGYVRRATMYVDVPPYSLTHEGRGFLIASGLL